MLKSPNHHCYDSLPDLSKVPRTATHGASLPLHYVDIFLKRADVYVYILQSQKPFGTLLCLGKPFPIIYWHDIFSLSQYIQNMILSAACGAEQSSKLITATSCVCIYLSVCFEGDIFLLINQNFTLSLPCLRKALMYLHFYMSRRILLIWV